MNPVKEYAIEHERELVELFLGDKHAEYLNFVYAKFNTTESQNDFATNHSDWWTFVTSQALGE